MENNDEYYSKIIYKKNAFSDLAIDLKVYYRGKKVMFISTKSISSKYITDIVNSLLIAGCEFSQFIAKHRFDEKEMGIISDKFVSGQFDLIIVLGSGKAVDVCKYFSNIYNIPYFVCPSAPTNFSYFTKLCVNPYDSTRSFLADEPERIYICEAIIKKTPRFLIKQGICFILSFYENILSCMVDNILFDKNNDTTGIRKVLSKLENVLDDLVRGDDDSKLSLMDYMIDLGYVLKNADFFKMPVFNLYFILEKISKFTHMQIASGEAFLVCSKMLLESYKMIFSKTKIERLLLPNYEKTAKKVQKYGIFCKKTNNFAYFDKLFENIKLLDRLNNLKEEFLFQCKQREKELMMGMEKVSKLNNFSYFDKINLEHCLDSISIMPFVCESNFIVSLIGGMGAFNLM